MENNEFSSRIGFILTAAGSAVGLGNIWRFPYLAARYGGGIFLLIYLILAITFGFTLMITEIAIGRKTRKSPIEAYGVLDKRFKGLGIIAASVPIIIFPYYCVIGGWVVKYMSVYVIGKGHLAADGGNYFNNFMGSTVEPIIYLAIFLIVTSIVVMFGVQKGIEKVSTILMPVLVAMLIGISIYSLTLDGAWDGFIYYIKPNFSEFSIKTVIAAMGQLFYSMSLAMGIMITYGSYMRKQDNLEKAVRHIELFDTGVAFLAGMMIVPAVFAFSGGDKAALDKGPSLMFITLPQVFSSMPGGQIIGFLFFVLVFLAALTSAISLMETIVSILADKFKTSRRNICIIIMFISMLIALPSTLGYGVWSHITILGRQFLDFFDFISNSILMPIVALLTCLLIAFVTKTQIIEEELEISGEFKSKKIYNIMIKFVAPIFLLIILVSSIFGTV